MEQAFSNELWLTLPIHITTYVFALADGVVSWPFPTSVDTSCVDTFAVATD